MTRQDSKWQRAAGGRPVTWRLAAGGCAAVVAALVIPSLPAAGAAAAASGRAAGHGGPAAAASGGTLRAWGLNGAGQLGDGTVVNRFAPVAVKLPSGVTVTSVRAGCFHTLALTSTGKVLAWGDNTGGQLGNGTTIASRVPVPVSLPPGTKVTAVRAGCSFSLALTSAGKVLAWGDNSSGQLGDGNSLGSDTPIQLALPKVTAISTGSDHTLALTSTGQVLAWGRNDHGQLGDGTTDGPRSVPVTVKLPPGTKVTAVTGGVTHSLALTSAGKVLAWGDNSSGQLGDGSTGGFTDTPVPVSLPRGTSVRGIFAGCAHSLALTTTGKVLAWGSDGFGQLGDGLSSGVSDVPVRAVIPRGIKVTAISAGCFHSLALTSNGHVLAWGLNRSGELGVDRATVGASDVAVRVKLPASLSAIGIGSGPAAHDGLAIVRKAKP